MLTTSPHTTTPITTTPTTSTPTYTTNTTTPITLVPHNDIHPPKTSSPLPKGKYPQITTSNSEWEDEKMELVLSYEKKIDDLQKHLQTLQNQFENSENLRKETEADLLKLRKEVEFRDEQFNHEINLLKLILYNAKKSGDLTSFLLQAQQQAQLISTVVPSQNTETENYFSGTVREAEAVSGAEESSESSNSSLMTVGLVQEEAQLLLQFDKVNGKKARKKRKKKKPGFYGKSNRRKNWALLPNSARSILRKWLQHHLEYPYPSEKDKKELIEKTHLTPKQISNWFAHERHKMARAGTITTTFTEYEVEEHSDMSDDEMYNEESSEENMDEKER